MLKVVHLIKFLSEINPHTSPVRLALYNYLKSFRQSEEELSPSILTEFFYHVLEFSHWLSNRSHLGHEVQILLKNFNGFYQNKFDLSDVRFPETLQIVDVDNPKDNEELLNNYLHSRFSKSHSFKLVQDQKKWLAFVLRPETELIVFQFDKRFVIRNGHLEPLRHNLILRYDHQCELLSDFHHFIELSPQHLLRFQIKNEKISGVITRGYMFQKVQDFHEIKIHELPRLFWSLKRVEQFFIKKESDPFYQDIYKKLKDISLGIWEKNSESWQNYMSILLSQADSALENVYLGDKNLENLILRVRQILASEKSEQCQPIQPKSVASTNQNLMTSPKMTTASDLTNF